jgi:hypothetical protein
MVTDLLFSRASTVAMTYRTYVFLAIPMRTRLVVQSSKYRSENLQKIRLRVLVRS